MVRLSVKGVTPVVATVLLLGITVVLGGMLVTVSQGYFDDLGTGVDTTDLSIQSVYAESPGGSLNMSLANTGDSAINTSNYDVFIDGAPKTGGDCMDLSDGEVQGPGESWTCDLNETMPDALDSIEIEIRAKESDRSWDYPCEPKTSDATSC